MSKLTNDPFESRQAINMPSAVWLLRKPIISHDMASHRTQTLQTQRWAIAKTTGQALQLGIRSRHIVLWDNVGWIGHQSGTVPDMMIGPLWHHQVTPLSCSTASPLLLCNTPYPPCRITPEAASVSRCCTTTSDLLCPALHPTNSPLWPASCLHRLAPFPRSEAPVGAFRKILAGSAGLIRNIDDSGRSILAWI
jgi:hypothetical protein